VLDERSDYPFEFHVCIIGAPRDSSDSFCDFAALNVERFRAATVALNSHFGSASMLRNAGAASDLYRAFGE
jgi:hypothetical protein